MVDTQTNLTLIAIIILVGLVFWLYFSREKEGFEEDTKLVDLSGEQVINELLDTNLTPEKLSNSNIVCPSPTNLQIEKITESGIEYSFNTPQFNEVNSKCKGDGMSYYLIVAKYKDSSAAVPVSDDEYVIYSFSEADDKVSTSSNLNSGEKWYRKLNLKMKDENDKPIFYRLGLMAVYSNGFSQIITHYNIRTFRLGVSVLQHLAILQHGNSNYGTAGNVSLENIEVDGGDTVATADGKFEVIKRQLGGYPDNLFIEERTGPNSLSELINRQLSLGILNVNVHTNTSQPN